MSKENDDSFELSRRKALAGLGGIGVAGALGVGGTWAQFTDTEEQVATFSAGGVDGTIKTVATYNGELLDGQENPGYVSYDGEGPGASIHFEDVKPGDYGAFTFTLEVQNNPAWVATCAGIESDTDGQRWEPEAEIESSDGTVNGTYKQGDGTLQPLSNSSYSPTAGQAQSNADADLYGAPGVGELAENLLLIPFYNDTDTAYFWDDGGDSNNGDPDSLDLNSVSPSALGTLATSESFWQLREGEDDVLLPASVRELVSTSWSAGTQSFDPNNGFTAQSVPTEYSAENVGIAAGCIPLEGRLTAESAGDWPSDTYVDEQGTSALQPSEKLHFGFDWHLPFATDNEVQGDEMIVNMGFNFSQLRHTESPDFANVYSPGSNTP